MAYFYVYFIALMIIVGGLTRLTDSGIINYRMGII